MRKWIGKAIKRPGALRRKAKAAGMSTRKFALKHAHSPGRLGKEARLANTLRKFGKRKKGFRKPRMRG